jgi:hypothetical protein
VKARIYNRGSPGQSADLPTIRLSTLTNISPKTLTFPGAQRAGPARSNLLISDVNSTAAIIGSRQMVRVRVDLLSLDGSLVASGEFDFFAGDSIYLIDVIGRLGVSNFERGQIRVTELGNQALLWGYLSTINSDGAVSVFSGLNP